MNASYLFFQAIMKLRLIKLIMFNRCDRQIQDKKDTRRYRDLRCDTHAIKLTLQDDGIIMVLRHPLMR